MIYVCLANLMIIKARILKSNSSEAILKSILWVCERERQGEEEREKKKVQIEKERDTEGERETEN